MSAENHPNIHAVGMTIDVVDSVLRRIRGKAAEVPFAEILKTLDQDIQDFVVAISTKLDERFPNE